MHDQEIREEDGQTFREGGQETRYGNLIVKGTLISS
jgi:hypothetical protein